MIENELDRIEQLYGMGVRSMGITYNTSNALGTGGGDIWERDGGLTGFGARAVGRMNDVGMTISVSHTKPADFTQHLRRKREANLRHPCPRKGCWDGRPGYLRRGI